MPRGESGAIRRALRKFPLGGAGLPQGCQNSPMTQRTSWGPIKHEPNNQDSIGATGTMAK